MSSDAPLFSIIIPFKAPGPYLNESLPHLLALAETDFEIILVPDDAMDVAALTADPRVRALASGPVSPAVKRDMGSASALGTYLAFIDDDAYPDRGWLSVARAVFEASPEVSAVGGPAETPPDDPFWARASGAVFLSRLTGFPERYRPTPPRRFVDDWPTVNLIVRRDAFFAVGGFDTACWPGEDTKFCLDLVHKKGGRILYLPELFVWHHRRPGLAKHLRQVGNYGLHRGHFVRVHPETSRRPCYFAPAAWVLFLAVALAYGFFLVADGVSPAPVLGTLLGLGFGAYGLFLLAVFLELRLLRQEAPAVALAAIPYVALTHIWYGLRFLYGLTRKTLTSSLGR
ncbi:Glycosyltransferases involved in cell wall biogenesis [Desulfovibrio sp. DV]|uniref:glycosyltransferase n=1 Tax=Desulfovibrio sp. DV TaxID=1844708 RepID=UPI00094B9948|nr:glycosyltransferase [Desulfovibrio sp. DV]OLN26156.1 Glycosyltransferases involved in cell wall biogenesis [Desulfovibrio sp. DV]